MFGFFLKKYKKADVIKIAEKQLQEKRALIESLRDYDTGKKDIQTSNLERRLPNIRVTP